MKRFANFAALFFVASMFIASCDDDDDNVDTSSPNSTDTSFVTKATYANLAEIDFARLAQTKSTNDSILSFAQHMITEHTTALSGLDSIANQFNYTLPTTIDSAHAALKTQAMGLSGIGFDSTYINSQIADHVNAINLFQNEVNLGNNPNIKGYASRMLPHLQEHLARAQSVKSHLQ